MNRVRIFLLIIIDNIVPGLKIDFALIRTEYNTIHTFIIEVDIIIGGYAHLTLILRVNHLILTVLWILTILLIQYHIVISMYIRRSLLFKLYDKTHAAIRYNDILPCR